MFLLLPVLGGADRVEVYRWNAADGTVVFSDRPQGHTAEPAPVPPVNLLEPVPPAASAAGAAPPPLPRRATADRRPGGPAPLATCEKLRREVEELWRQRRHGYPAGEGPKLRSRTRERQQALRDRCGVWR